MKHTLKITLSVSVALFASWPVHADCKKCHDDYVLDMKYCEKQEPRSQATCRDNANKKLAACAAGGVCR
jgi:hypothetical protein